MAMQHREWFIETPCAPFSEAPLPAAIERIRVGLGLAGKVCAHNCECLVVLNGTGGTNNVPERILCPVDNNRAARPALEITILVLSRSQGTAWSARPRL